MALPFVALGLALVPYGSLALALLVAIASFRDGARPPEAEVAIVGLSALSIVLWLAGLALSIHSARRPEEGVARTVSRLAVVVSAAFGLLVALGCLGGGIIAAVRFGV